MCAPSPSPLTPHPHPRPRPQPSPSQVRSDEKSPSLCNQSKRKRYELAAAAEQLQALLEGSGGDEGSGGGDDGGGGEGTTPAVSHQQQGQGPAAAYAPSEASKLVRKLGRAAASGANAEREAVVLEVRRLQQKASEGFRHLTARMGHVYGSRAAEAPEDFRARIDFWRDACGMPHALHERLHRLRIWRNASEHGDEERWRREGPRDEEELVALLSACDAMAQ